MNLADAITNAAKKASEDTVTMRRGTWTSGTTVNVGGSSVHVVSWVRKPTVANSPVLLMISRGSVVGFGLD